MKGLPATGVAELEAELDVAVPVAELLEGAVVGVAEAELEPGALDDGLHRRVCQVR